MWIEDDTWAVQSVGATMWAEMGLFHYETSWIVVFKLSSTKYPYLSTTISNVSNFTNYNISQN